MADLVDIASDDLEKALAKTLLNRSTFEGLSLKECEECGELIPEQRRALGGITLCVDCQTALEQKSKHFGIRGTMR